MCSLHRIGVYLQLGQHVDVQNILDFLWPLTALDALARDRLEDAWAQHATEGGDLSGKRMLS